MFNRYAKRSMIAKDMELLSLVFAVVFLGGMIGFVLTARPEGALIMGILSIVSFSMSMFWNYVAYTAAKTEWHTPIDWRKDR